MPTPEITIRHGRFLDLSGPAQRFGEIMIAAAEVELAGTMFDLTHELTESLDRFGVSPEVKALVRPGEEAVWVRGRAQRLFLIPNTSAEERAEKTFFFASFLALLPDEAGQHFGVPFLCSDTYGRSGLIFSSDDPPPAELKDRIADAFWSLLLSEPTHLEDYRDSILHSGTGAWLDFGIDDGDPFLEERM